MIRDGSSPVDVLKRASPRVILATGWLIFLVYSYPGYMRSSATDQLVDSRVGSFTDWASPTMTELWRLVGWMFAGPVGMLLLQSALLVAGVYVLVRRVASDRRAALVAAALLLFPPVATTTAEVCPEAMLAGLLIAGTATILAKRTITRLFGLALLLLACAMRDGAVAAVLPIVVLGFAWRTNSKSWRRYAVALLAWGVIAASAAECNAVLTDAVTERPADTLAALDVVGILRFAPHVTDTSIRRVLASVSPRPKTELQHAARALYNHPGRLFNGDARMFDEPTTEAEHQALQHARWEFIAAFPRAYVSHRWYQFIRELGVVRGRRFDAVYTSFLETPALRTAVHYDAHHSTVQSALVAGARWLGRTWLYRPVVYAAIALGLLGFAIKQRRITIAMLLISGIASELALAVVSSQVAFEHSHPLVVCTVLATSLWFARSRTDPTHTLA